MLPIGHIVVLLLAIHSSLAHAEMQWAWTSTKQLDDIGACSVTSQNCNFHLSGAQTAGSNNGNMGVSVDLQGWLGRPTSGSYAGFIQLVSPSNTCASGSPATFPAMGGGSSACYYNSLASSAANWDDGSSSGSTTIPSNWSNTSNGIYGIDIPGQFQVLPPLTVADLGNPIVMVSSATLSASQSATYNWTFVHWDPSTANNNTTSSTQLVAGTMTLSTNASTQCGVTGTAYHLNGSANWDYTGSSWNSTSLGAIVTAGSGTACSSGSFHYTGATMDQSGTYYIGGPITGTTGAQLPAVLLYKTDYGHTALAVQQSTISSLQDVAGSYVGFVYDTDQNHGVDTSTSSTHSVSVTINTSQCPSGSPCSGSLPGSTGYLGNSMSLVVPTTCNGSGTVPGSGSSLCLNTPVTGMFLAYVYDSTASSSNRGSAYCSLIQNVHTSDSAPPWRHGIICAGQKPGSSSQSTPFNLIVVSMPGAPGTQDTTFGSNGVVSDSAASTASIFQNTGPQSSPVYALDMTTDGKFYYVAAQGNQGHTFNINRYSQYGVQDTSWNAGSTINGWTNWAPGGKPSYLASMKFDSANNWVYAVGAAQVNTTNTVAAYQYLGVIARFKTDGTLDTTFNSTSGYSTLSTGSSSLKGKSVSWASRFFSVAVQPDGKVLAGGYTARSTVDATDNTTGAAWLIARYLTTGALDTTFTASGYVSQAAYDVSTNNSRNAYVSSLYVESGGYIDVAGSCGDTNNTPVNFGPSTASWPPSFANFICVGRLTTTGTWDTGMIGDSTNTAKAGGLTAGLVYWPKTALTNYSNFSAGQMLMDSANKLVVTGMTKQSTYVTMEGFVARFTTTGALDTTFNGGNGYIPIAGYPVTTYSVSNGSTAMTVGSGSNIAVGSYIEATGVPANTTVASVSGTTVTMSAAATASTSGIVKFIRYDSYLTSITKQADGKLLVAGRINVNSGSDPSTIGFVARVLDSTGSSTDGQLDASFGVGGIAIIGPSTYGEAFWSSMLDSYGRLVLGGIINTGSVTGTHAQVPYLTRITP